MRSSRELIRLSLILALLAGTACGYGGSIRRAERAADQGDWYKAWAQYREAYEVKSTPEVAESMRQANEQAIARTESDAHAAIDTRDWAGAAEQIKLYRELTGGSTVDPDVPKMVGEGLNKEVLRLLDEERIQEAYDLGESALTLFPGEVFAESAIDKARSRLRASAGRLMDQERYAEALDTILVITEREPDWKEILARDINEIQTRWAAQLSASAKASHKAGRKGAATLSWLKAYELAKRSEDLDAAKAASADLATVGLLDVVLKIRGDRSRTGAVEAGLLASLVELEHVASSRSPTAELMLDINAPKAACTEVSEAAPKDVDYVAGQREVPNPEHVTLSAKSDELKAERATLQAEIDANAPALAEATETVRSLDSELDAATTAREEATKNLDRATKHHAEQKALVDRLKTDRDAASDPAAVADFDQKIKHIGRNVTEWAKEVTRWATALEEATTTFNAVQAKRTPAAEVIQRVKPGQDKALARVAEIDKRIREVDGALLRTAPTMMEDVRKSFAYEVLSWTRTCDAPMSAKATAAWASAQELDRALESKASTEDVSFEGKPEAGVEADPKEYPKTDEELVKQADKANLEALLAWTGAFAKEHFAAEVARTLELMPQDKEKGADTLVALWVHAPTQLDEAATKALRDAATTHYRVEKLDLLRPDPALSDDDDLY